MNQVSKIIIIIIIILKKDKERSERTERGERGEREVERILFFYFFLCFFLRSMEIGQYVFVGAEGKVAPRNEGYVWVPKSWSFVKLHEVGNFPTYGIYSLKAI